MVSTPPPPPPYTLTDQNQTHRRHSYHPSNLQSHPHHSPHDSATNQYQSRLGRTSHSLSYHPNRASYNPTSYRQQSPNRGLGSSLAGLGASVMFANTINQNFAGASSHSGEDPLAILRRYDTVLLIDDSASMSLQNRWKEAALAVAGLAEALVQYDSDGIDVYFMNSVEHLRNTVSAAEVNRLFERVQPTGPSTPTDVRVEELLGVYLDRLEAVKMNNLPPVKPLNLIVITDGEADDPDTLAYALAGFTERLDEGRFPLNQLGVQFIQIGNDKTATKFLRSLDDELKSSVSSRRDIVDTTPYQGRVTAQFLIKALLGGINKRIDHQAHRN